MLILAGLGNPEPKYAKNRHNIGFAACQVIMRRWDFGPERARFSGLASEGQIATPAGPVKALSLRPGRWPKRCASIRPRRPTWWCSTTRSTSRPAGSG
jgi:hypothetical protein